MAALLDTRRVRNATPAEQRDYYIELLGSGTIERITSQLLEAIEQGLLPPAAFSPWLGVSKSPEVIREAMKQDRSILVRKLGIWRLNKELSSRRWKETWNGVGGTVGMLDIFSSLSIYEVQETCKGIGSIAKGRDLAEKRGLITELFQGLQPSIFPDTKHKTADQRPLARQYRLLLPACSEELVERVVGGDLMGLGEDVREQRLQHYQSVIMRKVQLQSLEKKESKLLAQEKLKGLVRKYPSKATTEPTFSASMGFALTLLHTLAGSDKYEVESDFFVDDLVQPLLRRAMKKHVAWAKIQEIVDLMMKYLEAHPTIGEGITLQVGGVRHLIAQCWTRQPHLFENQLKRLCSHPVFGTQHSDAIGDWSNFLKRIPLRKRYQLLRLVFQASTGLNLDVDADLKRLKGALGFGLLEAIGSEQALSLFLRLQKARGDECLVEMGPSFSVLNIGSAELYHIVLQTRNGNFEEAERFAESYIKDCKKKAASTAQAEQRGSYAQSALFAAIGSGSLNMLQDVTEWNKRFLRDPLAIKKLYLSRYPQEAVRLLSGIPDPLKEYSFVGDLRMRIEKANSILVDLFDTACSALQEPSFYMGDWMGVLGLFQSIVNERMKLSSQVKNFLSLSEEEVYRNLWETTITMLISVEEKANQEGHERLKANRLRGILDQGGLHDLELRQDPDNTSTMRFLNELARARDELWRKLRPKRHPAVAALPAPLPLGLSIQDLTAPWVLDVQSLENVAPYVASRVKATLFPDPMEALQPYPTDEESRKAIGAFVDSYQYALRLYIPKSCSRSERELRLQEVWDFATGPLSSGRMTADEAGRFWRAALSATVSKTSPDENNRKLKHQTQWPPRDTALPENEPLPLIPKVDDPKKPSEWNPFAVGSPTLPSRFLEEPTYIDVALQTPGLIWSTNSQLNQISKPEVPASEMNPILRNRKRLLGSDGSGEWYRSVRRRCQYNAAIPHSSRKTDEGSVLAALLYLDTKFRSTNKRLLESMFPQSDDTTDSKDFRYPSLYLDDDFLSDETLDPRGTVHAIKGHFDQIPPVLLHQLASNVALALEAADPKDSLHNTLQEVAILLVIHLEESDRPSLAGELAIAAILDRPNTSSWHRQILKPSFLHRLPARDARAMIEAFVERMLGRMSAMQDQKKQAHVEVNSSAQAFLGSSVLKVSTIKLLAQILRSTGIVSEEFAFSTLSSLFQKATHIDVRSNVIYSLLDMLRSTSKERVSDIITVLEPAVLLAGNLNEREPVTEDHWKQVEKDISLPEPQEHIWTSLSQFQESPIFDQLISSFRGQHMSSDRSRQLLERILLPTLDKLKEQTTKWITLFLQLHGFDQATQKSFRIPPIPRNEICLLRVQENTEASMDHIPRALIEQWVDYITFCCAPPEPIRAFNKKLRDDPASRSKPGVSQWLDLYGDHIVAQNLFTNYTVRSALECEKPISQKSGVTPEFVQKQFMRIFTAVFWNDGPLYENLYSLVQDFLKHGCLVKAWWKPHGKAIIKAMIAQVNAIRTQQWQRDPERKPSTLPDTFSWRLLLLDYAWPVNKDTEDDREKKCKHFADQLALTIDGMATEDNANTKVLYHKHLAELKKFLNWNMVSIPQPYQQSSAPIHTELMNNRLLTAIYLGDIARTGASFTTTSDMLRVDVAIHLISIIDGFHKVDKDLIKRCESVLDSWKACENEDVRGAAYEVLAKYDLSGEKGRELIKEQRLVSQAWGHEVNDLYQDLIDYSDEEIL